MQSLSVDMNAMHNSSKTGQRGMTLIEVLVTVFVMSIGLMGLAALQMNTLKESVDVSRRSQGVWLVDELAARMRVNPAGAAAYVTAAANDNLCSGNRPVQCADFNSGTSKTNAASCSADQMATFDVWQVVCGYDLDDIESGSADRLNVTAKSITCTSGVCDISLSWESRAAAEINADNAVQTIQQTIILP